MGYTKRQFVTGAFEEIGIADYVFDLSSEVMQTALRRLDSMMAEWNARGIRLSYPIPSSPEDSDLDEPSTVPDSANEAIILNLALRVAPGLGKVTSVDTKIAAKNAYNTLLSRACAPSGMQLPMNMPLGAGNKPIGTGANYVQPPEDRIEAGPDSYVTLD